MQFAFDLISDLHVDSWNQFNWTGQATSPVCIVAGDICSNRTLLLKTLKHLGTCYQAVFYIDGNSEHVDYLETLEDNYLQLGQQIAEIPNVVYLQDNVVIIDGVAIVGTMGWWGFDFSQTVEPRTAAEWFQHNTSTSNTAIKTITNLAISDAMYMSSSVKRLQTHPDVKKIIMVTHTVPDPALIAHDVDLADSAVGSVMGNKFMMQSLAMDTERKIHTWCFGHYHGPVDQVRAGVRFVNHCRGRPNTKYNQHVYYPKRIVVDY
jgi:predicted phosphodiesterase